MAAPFIPLCSVLEVRRCYLQATGALGGELLAQSCPATKRQSPGSDSPLCPLPKPCPGAGHCQQNKTDPATACCAWCVSLDHFCPLRPSQSLGLPFLFPPPKPRLLSDAWGPKAGFSAQTSWSSSLLQDHPWPLSSFAFVSFLECFFKAVTKIKIILPKGLKKWRGEIFLANR